MLAKAKEQGCKNKISLFFLCLNIAVAFSLGVITAYMSSNGCSKAFTAVAIISFLYIVINFMLIFWSKSWNKCFSYLNLLFIFTTLIITIVGIGFASYQSTCNVIACYNGLQSKIDTFFHDYRSEIHNVTDKYCDLASDKVMGNQVSASLAIYANQIPEADKQFYIIKGWPLAFLALQMILTLMHIISTFFNLYSCKGCKPKPKEETYISYF
ncbi:hypothetical protein ABPG74_020548 [Tetrahymena malaccensis]